MSDDPQNPPETGSNQITDEQLTDEIARKYDPDRLLRMVSKRAGRGHSLDHDIRAKYEKRFGVDLGHVRLITGEFAEEFNRQRGAYAVTVGGTGMILMGNSPDKSMASRSGQALLAHELTHVAQAKRGLWNAEKGGGPQFTQAEEHEAHHVEDQVAAGGDPGGGGGGGGGNKQAAAAKMAEALEKIKARVLDMAADAQRTNWLRNNMSRRP